MRMRDTSNHPKHSSGGEMTSGMRQGDDTAGNPGHGEAMDRVNRSSPGHRISSAEIDPERCEAPEHGEQGGY